MHTVTDRGQSESRQLPAGNPGQGVTRQASKGRTRVGLRIDACRKYLHVPEVLSCTEANGGSRAVLLLPCRVAGRTAPPWSCASRFARPTLRTLCLVCVFSGVASNATPCGLYLHPLHSCLLVDAQVGADTFQVVPLSWLSYSSIWRKWYFYSQTTPS